MPRSKLSALFKSLREPASPHPPSPAQLRQRERMREAAAFYRTVMSDPVRRAEYEARARKKGVSIPALTLSDYMREKK